MASLSKQPTFLSTIPAPKTDSNGIQASESRITRTEKDVLKRLDHCRCNWLRLYWQDYTSSARVRLIPMNRVTATIESGKPVNLSITKASLGMLQMDMMIPQITATGVYIGRPDWSSLRLGPTPGHASVYCEFKDADGPVDDKSDVEYCPRTILRKTTEKAASHGLTFLIGFEIEFVIVERTQVPKAEDKYRILQNDGHAWSMAKTFADIGREGSFNSIIDEIETTLEAADILIEQFHAENAPGQYEIVLPPLPPLEACDVLLHTRQIIASVAARHGFSMTLHPKPFAKNCGSASHVHMSISSLGGDQPEVYEAFYAGILKHYRAIIAFTYSNPTSYERMVDSLWAGGRWVSWGTQNKETPLRKCEAGHWEFKTMDGLANPYFAMAAILAAGTFGILSRQPLVWGDCLVDPAKLTLEQRKELGISEMFPADLNEALKALAEDTELIGLLGSAFIRRYIDVKNAEMDFLGHMSHEERRLWIMERY